MEESLELNVSDATSETSKTAAASSVLGAIKRFIGMFILSDEEKFQAGIGSGNLNGSQDAGQVSEESDSPNGFITRGRRVT